MQIRWQITYSSNSDEIFSHEIDDKVLKEIAKEIAKGVSSGSVYDDK